MRRPRINKSVPLFFTIIALITLYSQKWWKYRHKLVAFTQWHSQRGGRGGGDCPLWQKLCPPLAPPNEITLCTEVYGEPPFWVPVSPPCSPLSPPLPPPHFEKSGYAHEISHEIRIPAIFVAHVALAASPSSSLSNPIWISETVKQCFTNFLHCPYLIQHIKSWKKWKLHSIVGIAGVPCRQNWPQVDLDRMNTIEVSS